MPKRRDIKKILVIGAGPIIIGQACEFDYSGTQACKALKDEGFEVVLINSNPATIMTDPGVADKTYIEPITIPVLEEVIKKNNLDLLDLFSLFSNRNSSSNSSLLLFSNNKKFTKAKFIYWQKCISTSLFWSI